MAEGLVQVPIDSSGKRIEALAVTVPEGTVVTNSDGTTTTLTASTVFYRQVVAIGDPSDASFAAVRGDSGRGALNVEDKNVATLEAIEKHLEKIVFLLSGALGVDATDQ